MIHKIAIENFFSVADRQELDFTVPGNAPNLQRFKPSPSDRTHRLPTVIGLFGPNASGKSTILRAIANTIFFACQSFNPPRDYQVSLLFQAYRHKNWWGKPTKILIEFDCHLSEADPFSLFRYELHIAHSINALNTFTDKTVVYEALSYAPKGKFRRLFEREKQNIHFGQEFIPNNNDPRKDSIRPNASVISTLAMLNHQISNHILQFIGKWQSNIIGFTRIQGNAGQILTTYAQDKNCLEQLNRDLRRLDVGLESMVIEQGNHGLFAKFQHTGLDGFIFLPEESNGTQRFIEIFPRLHYALQTGSVAIIDEIDTDLHPNLLPELFRWFSDPERNPNGAQLFFTAHNPALLDELEKEQVFFTEKPNAQSSRVFGARDIKGLRREPSLMKKYLAGELGAIPHIG